MEYAYTSRFKILETFKINDHQEIYIGMELLDEGVPVVINHIKNLSYVNMLKNEPLLESFTNLVYTEVLEDEIVIITKVMESEPLLAYLEDNYIPMGSRMNLALMYLQKITKYDGLTDSIKNILIDEAQLAIKSDEIVFDELILINEDLEEIEFNSLSHKISSVLEKIIYFEYKNLRKEEFLLVEIQEFVKDLQNNTKYHDFNQIMEEFRKLYIYHVCMESIEDPEEKYMEEKYMEKKKISKMILIVASLILALGLGAYALMASNVYTSFVAIFNQSEKTQEAQQQALPEAYFTINEGVNFWEFINGSLVEGIDNTIEEYLWEITKDEKIIITSDHEDLRLNFNEAGKYTVELMIRDRFNQWSEKYTQIINVSLVEEVNIDNDPVPQNSKEYTFAYEEGITKDLNMPRSQGYSFRIDKYDPKPELKINLEGKNANTYDTLNFWIKGNTIGNVSINIKGYYQGSLKFQEDIIHSVKVPEMWAMVNLTLASVELNEIVFNFPIFENQFWIADIQLDTYK